MKNRIIQILASIILSAGSGVVVYNYTGTDLTLQDGTELKTYDLTRSLTKFYQDRATGIPLKIVFHHTAGNKNDDIENIAKFHVNQRGWPEIAYHIAINYKGDVFLLNDIKEKTYHDSGNNTIGIGIVLIGNYEEEKPSEAMIESAKLVSDALCQTLNIKSIIGHKDESPTLCPGVFAYNQLKEIFY